MQSERDAICRATKGRQKVESSFFGETSFVETCTNSSVLQVEYRPYPWRMPFCLVGGATLITVDGVAFFFSMPLRAAVWTRA